MAGKSLQITYVGDSSRVLAAQKQIDAGHTRMQTGVQKTSSFMQQAFGVSMPLAAAAAAAGVVVLAKTIIDAAADENEAINKSNVIFGKAAESVLAFSETSASAFGIAKAEALNAAGGFGAMLSTAGLAEDAAASMSIEMVGLAGDMASFNNQDPSDMLERLRSGLAGEAEPLRQFGVFLSEARVKSEAYESGIADLGSELTEAQKVQARYNLILQDTTKQQGDFGRTLGESLPNQMRVMRAELTDLAADFGQVLLPIMLTIVQVLRDTLGPVLQVVADNIGLVLGVLVGFAVVKYLPALLFSMALGLEAIGAASIASGLAGVAAGLAGIAAAAGPVAIAIGVVAGGLYLLRGDMEDAEFANARFAHTLEKSERDSGDLQAAIKGLATAEREGTRATNEIAAAHEEAAAAARDQRLAVLALSDQFLGIVDSSNQVSEAQRTLNELERKGREDTKAYEDAVLDALEAQIGLEDAVLSYGQELAESGETAKEVKQKVRELGDQFGIQDGIVVDLIQQVQDYIDSLNNIPSSVSTQINQNFPGSPQQLQHGGIVTRPTVALIGEAGPEAVVPLGRGGGIGGAVVNIYVEGSVVAERELLALVRRGLIQTGVRNVTGGIT